jgi:hypothetical protein
MTSIELCFVGHVGAAQGPGPVNSGHRLAQGLSDFLGFWREAHDSHQCVELNQKLAARNRLFQDPTAVVHQPLEVVALLFEDKRKSTHTDEVEAGSLLQRPKRASDGKIPQELFHGGILTARTASRMAPWSIASTSRSTQG